MAVSDYSDVEEAAEALDDTPSGLDVQWHPRLHEEWGHEQLYFMRLGFSPIYEREEIKAALLSVFAQHDVRSYVAYEVFGIYDVMLRLWLPPHTTQQAFARSIETRLTDVNMTMSDVFVARAQERNWLWEEHGRMVEPDAERLAGPPPSPAELRALQTDPGVFQEYRRQNLIRELPLHQGVKFFMVIPAPQTAANVVLRKAYKAVGSALDEADLVEHSLYIGQGFGNGGMLVMGRVGFERYYDIGEKLLGGILNRLTDLLGVRPYTFPGSGQGFLCYEERPPGTDLRKTLVAPTASVDVLLEGGETRWMEAKGSAYVPLDPLLRNGVRVDKPNTDASRQVRRAVASLLNTEGGTVVLGALEQGSFSDEQIAERFGDAPRRGDFICIGLDAEIAGDRDGFQLRLKDTLNNGIAPKPAERVSIEFAEVEGRTLVLLRVQRPRSDWFWLDKNEFVIRDGNGARLLTGGEIGRYISDHSHGKGDN